MSGEQQVAKAEEWPLSPNWWLHIQSERGTGEFHAFDFIKIEAHGPNEYRRPITSVMVPRTDGFVCESHSFIRNLIHQNTEALHAELAAAKAEVERVSKLYLEMRDGHEHVVHIMHADLDRHKRALEKCKEQRNVNIHGIDTREIDYIAGQYDEEISRILEGKD